MARNFKSAITKGKKVLPKVTFAGGVAANKGVAQALETVFGWEPGTLVISEEHTALGAIGTAILAEEVFRKKGKRSGSFSLEALDFKTRKFPNSPPLSMENVVLLRDQMVAIPPRKSWRSATAT